MNIDNTQSQMRKGILEFCILSIIKRGESYPGDIVDEIPLSQSTVSQHLKELKAAGLIKGDIEGTSVCYCIDAVAWEKAKTILNNLFESPALTALKCC